MSDGETLPLPPDEYMRLVCGPYEGQRLHDLFEWVGARMVKSLIQLGVIGRGYQFLDIGCGCGRVARHLLNQSLKAYVGFDRHREMIEWCHKEIASRSDNFRFLHFDIKSAYQDIDGEAGSISATEFRFPFEDHSFDGILLASVFTHMPLVEIGQYLGEIYRVVKPSGSILLSVFFSETSKEVLDGKINFLLPKDDFLNTVRGSHFYPFVVGMGDGQHWYLLRPLPIEFDPSIYASLHRDVADAGVDPAEHYVSHGWKEGRRLK